MNQSTHDAHHPGEGNDRNSGNPAHGSGTPRREHPTRLLLTETARGLLAEHPAHAITAEMALITSGVSKGSLYHFFEDLEDLLGTAMVLEFTSRSQENIAVVRERLAQCDSTASALDLIREITRRIREPEVHRHRMNRISLIGFSRGNEKFRRLLAAEQSGLTDAMAMLFAQAQQLGWLDSGFDPRAGAVLLQSVNFGQVVDEISETPLSDDAWNGIMDTLIRRMFAPQT